jgi:hypothetical protein
MKPIKMHPLPETEKQSSPKEAPMEGAHGATGIGASLGGQDSIPDPEVSETAPRRRFTAGYKLRILQEIDNCTEPGGIGMILRKGLSLMVKEKRCAKLVELIGMGYTLEFCSQFQLMVFKLLCIFVLDRLFESFCNPTA